MGAGVAMKDKIDELIKTANDGLKALESLKSFHEEVKVTSFEDFGNIKYIPTNYEVTRTKPKFEPLLIIGESLGKQSTYKVIQINNAISIGCKAFYKHELITALRTLLYENGSSLKINAINAKIVRHGVEYESVLFSWEQCEFLYNKIKDLV